MLPMLAGAGLGIGTSLIGQALAKGDRDAARALLEQNLKDYEAMGIPSIEAQQLLLGELKSAGELTPEMEQMVSQGPSAVGEIALDPGYKTAQLRALDELSAIGDAGGLRLSDEAQIEDALSKVRQQERGSREAIMANARERGVAGSGMELAAQLSNQQNSAENAHREGLNVAAMAQDRALQAIMQGGQLAGDIRGQEYGEKLDAARAADEINRFNTTNQIGMNTRNVGSRNAAQEYNLGNKQRIMDSNVGLKNDEQRYNKSLYQTQFGNQMDLNQAKANARSGQASNLQNSANATQQMWGQVGGGVANMGQSIYDKQASSANRQADRDFYSNEREKDRLYRAGVY